MTYITVAIHAHDIINVARTLLNIGIVYYYIRGTGNGMREAIRLDEADCEKKTDSKSTDVYTWFYAHCSFLFINRTIHIML